MSGAMCIAIRGSNSEVEKVGMAGSIQIDNVCHQILMGGVMYQWSTNPLRDMNGT